jgi:hypothetical protein
MRATIRLVRLAGTLGLAWTAVGVAGSDAVNTLVVLGADKRVESPMRSTGFSSSSVVTTKTIR